MSLLDYVKRLQFQTDIAKLKDDTKEISIKGDVKNVESLRNLRSLKRVYLVTVTQSQFDKIVPFLDHITDLKMYEIRCTNLSALGSLASLEKLDLDWNTKIEKLWDMSKLTSLKYLHINDFSKLHDVSAIARLPQLTELTLSGGMWNKLSLDSVKPLANLTSLKTLDLGNIEIKDEGSILPLSSLRQLDTLTIPSRFPTEEIARLSIELPNTKCEFFAPYVKVNFGDDKDILIVGKGKPRLSSKRDMKRIEKYVAEFKSFQDKYS